MPHLPCPCFCEECKRDRQASSRNRTDSDLSITDEECCCCKCCCYCTNMEEEESREEDFDSLNQEEDLFLEVVLHGINGTTQNEADQSSESLTSFEEDNRFSNENQYQKHNHKSVEEKLPIAQKIVCAKWEKRRKPTIRTKAYEKSQGRSNNLSRNNLERSNILKNEQSSASATKKRFEKDVLEAKPNEYLPENDVLVSRPPGAVEETKSNKSCTQKTININLNFNDCEK